MAATLSSTTLIWVPLAPLAGAIVAGFFGKAVGRRGAHMATILGVLVSLSKRIRELNGDLRLSNLNDDLKTLFELTKLDTLFVIA